MSINNLLETHRNKVHEKINNTAIHITDGKCGSYDEYKRQCGIITGLKASLRFMKESIDEINKDIDEDD